MEDFEKEDAPPEPVDFKFEDPNISFARYLESGVGRKAGPLPMGPEALQTQADYLRVLGDNQHPFDCLRRISLNPWCSPKDRIAASKALLEYTAAKMPTRMEVSGPGSQPIEIDTKAVKRLSNDELDTLIKLLDKANGHADM
jgi:hypothetical protein